MLTLLPRYCCSDFLTYKDTPFSDIPDLQGQYHPIFNNLSSGLDRQILEMPLQLASRLIQAPALIPFINVLSRGKVVDMAGNPKSWPEVHAANAHHRKHGTWSEMIAIHPPGSEDKLNETTKAHAQMVLFELAGMIRFQLMVDQPGSENLSGGCWIDTQAMTPRNKHCFPNGTKTIICISTLDYQQLVAATIANDTERLCLLRVQFAMILVHEICHALGNALWGPRRPEPFYRAGAFAELGFVAEVLLTGGRLGTNESNGLRNSNGLRDHLCLMALVTHPVPFGVLTQMPSPSVRYAYEQSGGCYATRPGFRKQQCEVVWRIPNSYFESLLSSAFWDGVADDDTDAVQAPMIAAWVFESYGAGIGEPVSPADNLSDVVRHELSEVLAVTAVHASDASMSP